MVNLSEQMVKSALILALSIHLGACRSEQKPIDRPAEIKAGLLSSEPSRQLSSLNQIYGRNKLVKEFLPQISKLLTDGSPEVKKKALHILRVNEILPEISPDLLSSFLSHSDQEVQLDAALLLLNYGPEYPADDISKILLAALNNESEIIRWTACKGLAKLDKRPRAAVLQIRTLLNDPSNQVAKCAIQAAMIYQDRFAHAALIKLLERDDQELKIRAAIALARLGDAEAIQTALPWLVAGIKSQDANLRFMASDAFKSLGDKAENALPDVVKLLEQPEMELRLSAVQALTFSAPPEGVNSLKVLLTSEGADKNLLLRYAAEMGKKAEPLKPVIAPLLDSRDPAVRRQSALALAAIVPENELGDLAFKINAIIPGLVKTPERKPLVKRRDQQTTADDLEILNNLRSKKIIK